MDTHSSMAAAAAALYKQLSTLAGFVSQSSVTRTGHAAARRWEGREGRRKRHGPTRSNRSPGTNWNGHSVVTEEWARARGEGVRASQYRDY